MLHVNDLTFRIEGRPLLDSATLALPKGRRAALIGRNGSGKTTLLQVIAGLYQPTKGNVKVNGLLAPILQLGSGFQMDLLPRDNIIIYGMLLGFSKKEIKKRIQNVLQFAELEKFSGLKVGHFSSGMLARLAFSTVLQLDPDILLMDEIMSVGDIGFREKSLKAFNSFIKKGKTILYATNNLSTLSNFCDRVLLIHNGKMISMGEPNEVIQKYKEILQQEKAA